MLIARRKHSILHARDKSTRVRGVTIGAQPSRYRVVVGLSTGPSRRPRANPFALVTHHPFQTAGRVSSHRAHETPYRSRVSSKMSPTGHPRDDQTLSRLLYVGACRRAESYTSRLARCVRRTGRRKVWSRTEECPKEFAGIRGEHRDGEQFWRSRETSRESKIVIDGPRSVISIPRTIPQPESRLVP